MDAAEITADLYRQPEDYDFQESIECDLGICHCDGEAFNIRRPRRGARWKLTRQ